MGQVWSVGGRSILRRKLAFTIAFEVSSWDKNVVLSAKKSIIDSLRAACLKLSGAFSSNSLK